MPAIVSVAVRSAPVLAATETVTVPAPLPLAGLTVTQLAPLDAVQPHVERFGVTDTRPVAPAAAAESEVAESVKLHPVEAWLTV